MLSNTYVVSLEIMNIFIYVEIGMINVPLSE